MFETLKYLMKVSNAISIKRLEEEIIITLTENRGNWFFVDEIHEAIMQRTNRHVWLADMYPALGALETKGMVELQQVVVVDRARKRLQYRVV